MPLTDATIDCMLRPMPGSPPTKFQGDFIAWRGGCGFLGMGGGGTIEPHSHYAIQLAIGWPTGLKVQFGRRATMQPCAAALIPSGAPHTIDVDECRMSVVLFIEPETAVGKALSTLLDGKVLYLDQEAVAAACTLLAFQACIWLIAGGCAGGCSAT